MNITKIINNIKKSILRVLKNFINFLRDNLKENDPGELKKDLEKLENQANLQKEIRKNFSGDGKITGFAHGLPFLFFLRKSNKKYFFMMQSALDRLIKVHPEMEIWWDSSPLVFKPWLKKMLDAAGIKHFLIGGFKRSYPA